MLEHVGACRSESAGRHSAAAASSTRLGGSQISVAVICRLSRRVPNKSRAGPTIRFEPRDCIWRTHSRQTCFSFGALDRSSLRPQMAHSGAIFVIRTVPFSAETSRRSPSASPSNRRRSTGNRMRPRRSRRFGVPTLILTIEVYSPTTSINPKSVQSDDSAVESQRRVEAV